MDIELDLINACVKQNRKAQFALYQKCYSLLLSVCLRYEHNKSDADHMLNKAFLKILNNLETYNLSVPFEAWIRRIMINTIIDEYRRNKKNAHIITIEEISSLGNVDTVVDVNEATKKFDERDLLRMLDSLPTVSKQVFNLFAVDGYAHKEIADMLNMSEGTSKWHVSFARKKLREMMRIKEEKDQIRIKGL